MTDPTVSKTEQVALKPCPFCDCKVTISKREYIWEFQHPKNDCFLGRLVPYTKDIEDATAKWNRRVNE